MDFYGIRQQQLALRVKIADRFEKILKHTQFIMGPEVHELEKKLADYVGVAHCITCSSGTDALLLSLLALDIGIGDAVFVPAFSFFSTAEVIAAVGATPIFVDVNPRTFNIDMNELRRAIRAVRSNNRNIYPLPRSIDFANVTAKAVIPVDIFGSSVNHDDLNVISKENNLVVIDDAAQAFGGQYKNYKICNNSHILATTSFYPTKPLGCYGDGGAIFTNSSALFEIIVSLRNHGIDSETDTHVRIGMTGRLDSLQAAVLLEKLLYLDEEIGRRNHVASQFNSAFVPIKDMQSQMIMENTISSYSQYSIIATHRDALINHLNKKDIPYRIYYPLPLHCQPALRYLNYGAQDFPNALFLSEHIISLPIHSYLLDNEIKFIIQSIQSLF